MQKPTEKPIKDIPVSSVFAEVEIVGEWAGSEKERTRLILSSSSINAIIYLH